jgi:UDP-2,3-diacylglucosamine pyrophosphatase LpxH
MMMFKDVQDFMPGESATTKHYRAIFISDLHLGTPGCQAEALLEFLKTHSCDTLYLVGDIIDGWQLRRKWYWPQAHNDVVQKLLRKARKGCRVIYVPGNHDEFARDFLDHSFGGVEVVESAVHVTADGKKLWVIHGDYFDGVIQFAKWLAYLGDTLYDWALKANRHLNYMRGRGYDGVVCGHIHHAEIRNIDGVLYCNDGDWVESLSTLVEHQDGRLEILTFDPYSEEKIAVKPTTLVSV